MNSIHVSTDQLRRALGIKEEIESLEEQLDALLSGHRANGKSLMANGRGGRKRRMSASARARIAAAQRARWAKQKGASQNAAPPRKRKLSAAGRARIVAATKARWARYRASRG